jgi:hypothetical protein
MQQIKAKIKLTPFQGNDCLRIQLCPEVTLSDLVLIREVEVTLPPGELPR